MTNQSTIRAPYAMLRELLGEAKPGEDAGDKCSTCFEHVHEGVTVMVSDFHKPEWTEEPECRRDPRYVWQASTANLDEDVRPFCRWVSAELVKRSSATRSLDAADREKLNALVATGMSLGDAMKQVRTVAAIDSSLYRWPVE